MCYRVETLTRLSSSVDIVTEGYICMSQDHITGQTKIYRKGLVELFCRN